MERRPAVGQGFARGAERFWTLLEREWETCARRLAEWLPEAESITIDVREIGKECHIEPRTVDCHLDALRRLDMIRISLRERGAC